MATEGCFDDYWQVSTDKLPPQPDGPAQRPLHIDRIGRIQPLDSQQGILPRKVVPDALQQVLFGQHAPSTSPKVQAYAILDAAKVANLPEMLERSGLEHCCLFNGAAYDQLKHVAPWLVRLEDGNGFCRNLFTRSDAPWHLWDAEPGIYLRADRSLSDVRQHFRKFTRLRDEDGKWYYFRFWEGAHFQAFMAVAPVETLRQLFGLGIVEDFLVIHSNDAVRFRLAEAPDRGGTTSRRPILDGPAMQVFSITAEVLLLERLFARLSARRPLSEPDFAQIIGAIGAEGFTARDAVSDLADWMALRGLTTLDASWIKRSLKASEGMPDGLRFARLANDEPSVKGDTENG